MKDVDPVEELHKIRRKICKKVGGTPADYFRYYLELDKKRCREQGSRSDKPRQTKDDAKQASPEARKTPCEEPRPKIGTTTQECCALTQSSWDSNSRKMGFQLIAGAVFPDTWNNRT